MLPKRQGGQVNKVGPIGMLVALHKKSFIVFGFCRKRGSDGQDRCKISSWKI